MENMKKGCMGLVWSSTTMNVPHAAEEEIKRLEFNTIGERHQDAWVDNIEIDEKSDYIPCAALWTGREGEKSWRVSLNHV
jgi:hypothetical protein